MNTQEKQLKDELKGRLITTFTARTDGYKPYFHAVNNEKGLLMMGSVPVEYNWKCPKCGTWGKNARRIGMFTTQLYKGDENGHPIPGLYEDGPDFEYEAASRLNTFLIHCEQKEYQKMELEAECPKCRKKPAWAFVKMYYAVYVAFIVLISVFTIGCTVSSVNKNKFDPGLILCFVFWVLLIGAGVFMVRFKKKRLQELAAYEKDNFPQIAISTQGLKEVFHQYYSEIEVSKSDNTAQTDTSDQSGDKEI